MNKTPPITIAATARSYPRLPYAEIAREVLGSSYRLSLTFLGADRARALNKRTRNKSYAPNVLSFPLEARSGEIYITPTVARKEAPRFGMTERGYMGFLFIHGLLHLKGLDHGSQMERLEKRYCDTFGFK